MRRISTKDALHLLSVIDTFTENPYRGDVEKLTGEEYTWRRRVGVYRILYNILPRERAVEVFDVCRRTSKTY
ncbi:MAG: type II toxin-antitoxin system RelE/ParE family toxin [Parcubacteria group bacterium]|nr:type II toxin-antitoxin system RelE/ParE family toxin [Parcubacteria group bacterium]